MVFTDTEFQSFSTSPPNAFDLPLPKAQGFMGSHVVTLSTPEDTRYSFKRPELSGSPPVAKRLRVAPSDGYSLDEEADSSLAGATSASFVAYLPPAHQYPMEDVVSKALTLPVRPRLVVKVPTTSLERAESKKRFKAFEKWLLGELYPYQAESVRRIQKQHSLLLADDMGLGKTRQALCAMLLALRKKQMIPTGAGRPVEPFILVAMPGLHESWRKEIRVLNQKLTDAGFEDLCITDAKFESSWREFTCKRMLKKWRQPDSFVDLVFVSYGALQDPERVKKLCKEPNPERPGYMRNRKFGGLIVDESHNIKNTDSKRSEGVLQLRKNICPFRTILLSGTPIENNLSELAGQLRVLAPRLFNKKWVENFSRCVERPIKKFLQELSGGDASPDIRRILDGLKGEEAPLRVNDIEEESGDREEDFWEADDQEFTALSSVDDVGKAFRYIQGIVNRYILQRSKNDPCVRPHLPPIPEPIHETIVWEMDRVQKAFYSAIENEFLESGRRKNYLKLVHDLNIVCNAPLLDPIIASKLLELEVSGTSVERVGRGKIDALCQKAEALLADEASNHRILIFVHRIEVAKKIKAELFSKLHGDVQFVSGEDEVGAREVKINLVREGVAAAQRVLIITDGVGSEGLCLHQFDKIICVDMPWSPSKWNQQIARAYRIGQERQVTIYEFACANNLGAQLDIEGYYKKMYAIKAQTVSSVFAGEGQGILRLIMPMAEVSMEELLTNTPEALEGFEESEGRERKAKKRKAPGLEGISVEELAEMVREDGEWDEEVILESPSGPRAASSFISTITAARQLFEGKIDGKVTEETLEDEDEEGELESSVSLFR